MLFSPRARFDRDLQEEMRLHRDLRERELRQAGASTDDAHFAAQRKFGNALRYQEDIRDAWGSAWVDNLGQDLRYAARLLRKSRGFALAVIISLALGVGANTAIFSVVYAVLWRPLPYRHPEQLVSLLENNQRKGIKASGFSYEDLKTLRDSGIFAEVAGAERHDLTLTGTGDATTVTTVVVTPEIFPLLNAKPLAGRYFLPEDNRKGASPVVLLSEGLWRTRYGGDPKIVGESIRLDQRDFTVVGIMPATFQVPIFGRDQQIWVPIIQDPLFSSFVTQRGAHMFPAIARLKPGSSTARAQAAVDGLSASLAQEFPAEDGGWMGRVQPLRQAIVGDIGAPLLLVFGAVTLVLLLACVNIANLLLARATSRMREMALRRALGAARSRIVRQVLTESAVLGLLGSGLAIALTYASTHALSQLLPANAPGVQPVQVDGWVLGLALLLSLAASFGFGLAPALMTAKADVQSVLKDGTTRSSSDRGGLRLRTLLTGAEIALATVLVIAAGLLARSLIKTTSVDPGFKAAHVVKAEVSLPRYQYSTPQQWTNFSNAVLERMQAQPGMRDSALAVPLPLADNFVRLPFSIPNRPAPPGSTHTADYVAVSPGYFPVMQIPLVRGRLFNQDDSESSSRVAIVSASFARLHFPNEDPIGKKLEFGFPPDFHVVREIVGVVGDVRDAGLARQPGPMMYVPFAQAPFWGTEIVVRSTLAPASVVHAVRTAVRSIDKNLPVTDIATMTEVVDSSVAPSRFRTWLLGAFGGIALLLAAAGIFGVVSYSVATRTREFGVRASLGATPAILGKMVLVEGFALACAGMGVGLAGALGLAHLLRNQLYGVGVYDPTTFFASVAVLLAVALVACYVPARRAMRVDPMIALRYD